MRAAAYLRLGRVSNLPTVWTNVLAGAALAGGALSPGRLAGPLAAGTLLYVGGMFLNDAFDRQIDRRERPERPIPTGLVSATEVFTVGFGLLALGWLALLAHGWVWGGGGGALVAGALLAGAIVLYDVWHKGNPFGPVLMGLCRALLYLMAGLAVADRLPAPLLAGALVLLCYLVGLTYVAKQETLTRLPNSWPLLFLAVPFVYAAPAALRSPTTGAVYLLFLLWVLHALRKLARRESIGGAVVALLAGIPLLDALLIARAGVPHAAWIAAMGMVATLAAQRWVRGT